MFKEFKTFLFRGNMLDLAVAFVVGGAFGAVVSGLVKDLVTPLIAAIAGKPDFSALTFTVNSSTFHYGDFIDALVSFVLVSGAVFFLVVLPVNHLLERTRTDPPPDPTIRKCPECLSDIPAAAKKCSFCTSVVTPTVQISDHAV